MSRKLYTCAEGHTSAYGRDDWCPTCSMIKRKEFGERMKQAFQEARAGIARQQYAVEAHKHGKAHKTEDCLICMLEIALATELLPQISEEPWWDKKDG